MGPNCECSMTDYELSDVAGIEELKERMANADSIREWSFILSDYVKFGNNKVADNVAIFNMNSATDCDNRNTKHCQVPDGMCYAYNDEQRYGTPLEYRRRQEYLWDCMDAETWAKAFLALVSRKRKPVDAIRFSESGDFRHRGDIIKVDRIAELLTESGIDVYTYSASDYLNWSHAEHFTVNQSNSRDNYGDRRFFALSAETELDDDTVWCPFDLADKKGMDKEDRPKCGECRLCIDKEGPDVAIPLH